jgi:hypothetical protein
MKKIIRYGFAALMVAGLGTVMASNSDARSFSGFLGQPQNPADYPCFVNSGGAVFNNCGTTRRFCVALPVDSSGHSVEVTVRAPDINHNISCFAQTVNRDATGFNFSGARSPGVFGSAQVVSLGSVSVPSAGAMYTCCDIAPSASLDSINYSN